MFTIHKSISVFRSLRKYKAVFITIADQPPKIYAFHFALKSLKDSPILHNCLIYKIHVV